MRYLLDGKYLTTSYLEEFNFANSVRHLVLAQPEPDSDGRHTLSGSGSFVLSRSVRQDNALDAETVAEPAGERADDLSGKFRQNKSLTVKMVQRHNLTTDLMERQIPDVQFRTSGPLFSSDEDDEDDTTAAEASFPLTSSTIATARANLYSRRAVDSSDGNADTTAWYAVTDNLVFSYSGSLFDVINVTRATFENMWSGRRWINPEDSAENTAVRGITSILRATSTASMRSIRITASRRTRSSTASGSRKSGDSRASAMCFHLLFPIRMRRTSTRISTSFRIRSWDTTPYQSEQKTVGFPWAMTLI